MGFVWALAGAILGLIVGGIAGGDDGAVTGLLFGAISGLLWSRVGALSARLDRAETLLSDLWATRAQADANAGLPREVAVPAVPPPVAPPPARVPAVAALDDSVLDLRALPPAPQAPRAEPALRVEAVRVARESAFDRFVNAIKRWFTEGNVPVKVGMLVLFAGVAALLKYAADEGWFTLPIELRLAGIALAGMAALVFGWRQRHARRAFALSLQGGAIGVLLLTVFAAFRLYGLLPAAPAFALMLVLVAGVGVLAVLQDALALAVLGILAGFAAPILISTGSGNHVVLFSYYALLNLAIFAIAWVRPWRALNLLGFFFTFAIGTAWGVLKYRPELFASTEPFLLLYFALYLAIPILYALRREPARRGALDGTLVFGNPLVAFALQAALLDGERMPLALSALGLGLVYLLLATALMRRARMLGESFAVLAVGFATLAVPLALSARVTGCVFALEGAALIWLGLRQARRLPQWTGLLLQGLAAAAFVIAFDGRAVYDPMFVNGRFVAALLIAGSAFASAWLYLRSDSARGLAAVLYLWGLAWWCGALLVEIDRHVDDGLRSAAMLAAAALTAWLCAEADRVWRQAALAWSSALFATLGVPLGFAIALGTHAFADRGLLAYAAYAALVWRALVCLRDGADKAAAGAHLGWLWTWTVALSLALREFVDDAGFGGGWQYAMLALPLLAMHGLALRAPGAIAPPLAQRFAASRAFLLGSQATVLALLFVAGLLLAGAGTPLPFVPLLNPLEIAQLAMLVAAAVWLRDSDAPAGLAKLRPLALAAAGFAFVTVATLRAVHHLGGLAWDDRILSASVSQTSLALVWSVLGVVGWVIGSRRGNRSLWLAGALLMAVVLVKLLLVDRQHLGNLFGIASFIAYGLLCTLIGYLAPAPPRATVQAEAHAA